MKKYLQILIITVLIFILNLYLPQKVNAEDNTTNSSSGTSFILQNFSEVVQTGPSDVNSLMNEGMADVNGSKQQILESPNSFTTIVKAVVKVLSYIPLGFDTLLSTVTNPYNEGINSNSTQDGANFISISDIVYGKISLFNINFFDIKNNQKDVNATIKNNVANWYYAIRTIAMILSLIILIYAGIRMAISNMASDQAKYKQILINWVKSFVILFILPYILIFTLNMADTILQIIPQKNAEDSFEQTIITNLNSDMQGSKITAMIAAFFTYCFLVYYHFVFFGKYFTRFFKVIILVIISPIITITYSLDRGSAHKKWFEEFIGAVFMQVVHALIYSIFAVSAGVIATKAPIITVAFFMALTKGEKIFNYVFKLKDQN